MAVTKLLNTGGLAALAAGLALIALPASAQERGAWRGGDGAASVQRGGGNWGNRGGGDGRGWNGRSQAGMPQASVPQVSVPQGGSVQAGEGQPRVRGNWRGGVDRSSPSIRPDRAVPGAQGRPQRWSGQNGGTPAWSGGDHDHDRDGRDGRWDGNRDGRDGRDGRWSGNRDGRDGRWDGNRSWQDNVGRANERWRHDNGNWGRNDARHWNRQWRSDRRYDWRGWRSSNRNTYRLGSYYAPYRGYSYRRVGIGFSLDRLFFGNRYWISDPWAYRLPAADGPYRWVRYYNDVVLVDIYSGEVVDVIYDFFW